MKKLMVMLAAVVIAAATQAATFDWQVATGTTYDGMNVYCISGSTAANIIKVFSATDDASKWTAAVNGAKPVVPTSGARGMASGSIDNVTEGGNLVFAIIDGSIAEGSKWFVLSDYTIPAGTTYEPPAGGKAQKIAVGTPTFGTFTLKAGPDPSGVPEPTSGLLLVLGGAALALRRKQK